MVARLMCVRFSLSCKSSVAPCDDRGSKLVADSDVMTIDGHECACKESGEIIYKMDDMLHELRKVGLNIGDTKNWFTAVLLQYCMFS